MGTKPICSDYIFFVRNLAGKSLCVHHSEKKSLYVNGQHMHQNVNKCKQQSTDNFVHLGSACESDVDGRSAVEALMKLEIKESKPKAPERTIEDLPPEVLLKVKHQLVLIL